MASQNIPDDRTIYTTFNDIFKGPHAAFRKLGPVQKVVNKHTKDAEIARLLREYGEGAVLDKLRILLAEGVFESTMCARMRFPDLFEASQAQTEERAASEAAAAAQQAQTLEETVEEALGDDVGSCEGDSGIETGTGSGPQEILTQNDHEHAHASSEEATADVHVAEVQVEDTKPLQTTTTKTVDTAIQVPSLFPIYLPFETGHRLLLRAQSALEASCFTFAATTAPEVLHQRGWHCPEAAELNVIVRQLLHHKGSLKVLQRAAGENLGRLTQSATRLRHAAVHRGRLTARVLEGLLADAEALAVVLGGGGPAAVLGRARRAVQRGVVELENSKSMLEARLRRALDDLATRRAELDRLERAAVARALRANAFIERYIGRNLEDSFEQLGVGEGSDVGDASDGGPGLSEGSASGVGDIDDLGDGPDGCETEGEDDCFEDAQENDSGVFLAVEVPGIEK